MVIMSEAIQRAATIEQEEPFSGRVQLLLDQRGCTKMWLANQLGISRQALNHTLKHNKKPKYVSEIAEIFQVTPQWLETGLGPMTLTTPLKQLTVINVYTLEQFTNADSLKNLNPTEQITSHNEDDNNNFAIKLGVYPAMSNKFGENSILIFSPDKIPNDGDFILVKIDKEILFRQMVVIKKHRSVISTKREHTEIMLTENKYEIIGTLIETRTRF